MANFAETLNPRFILFEPDPFNNGEWQDGYYHNWAVTNVLINQLDSPSHLISGSYNGSDLVNVKIEFIAPGVLETVTFSSTPVTIVATRQIWYANRSTGLIESIDLPGYAALVDNPDHFPLLLTGHYQETTTITTPFSTWLARKRQPRTDLVPIGSIIGIHPDVDPAKALNLEYYQQCNGNGVDTFDLEYPDGTTQTMLIPDISDNRFLMGGLTAGTGGSNVLIDHTHACGDNSATHTHEATITGGGTDNQSASHGHSYVDHYESHSGNGFDYQTGTGNSFDAYNSNKTTQNQNADHDHPISLVSFTTDGETEVHSHPIGSGAAPESTSNLPQYIKVIYYIRKK